MQSFKLTSLILLFGLLISSSCVSNASESQNQHTSIKKTFPRDLKLDTATFAGGCFWCIEASFEQIEGVFEAVSGYAGGTENNARYDLVSSGKTTHAEAVQIYFDPNKITYETLLDILFTAHDPTQLNRQGPDVGTQYRSIAFYKSPKEKKIIEEEIILPNVFTPNGDRVNDVFEIEIGEKLEFQIVVLNQLNQVIFKSSDSAFKWDGTMLNGEPAPSGNYVYFLSAKNMNGDDFVKSSMLLIQR